MTKARKRLSLRIHDTSRAGSAVSVQVSSANGAPPPDPETLRKIYATCIDLFQCHVSLVLPKNRN
jgi:hypothetical protein